MPSAIIDLGTNTFHLLIFEGTEILYKQSTAAKLGMGGIQNGIITQEGIQRGVNVLKQFRTKLDELDVQKVFAFGTSALRSATNKDEVLEAFRSQAGIDVKVIDGKEEATLIYEGVKKAVEITKPTLIVDIGGGSVEFIICNKERVLWLQSFEIGGQRLIEKFMKKDPIPVSEIGKLQQYLREVLLPLSNAIHQYQPEVLVGSSGTFDTLNDMRYQKESGIWPPEDVAGFDFLMADFGWAYESLVFANREQRMQIPGMIELRVDMIVVSVILIGFLIQTFGFKAMKISNYALKEGAMGYAQ